MESNSFRSGLTGTIRVFTFSLTQQFKSRVNRISLLIFFLLSAASVPVMVLTSGGGEKTTISSVKTVYVENSTGYALDFARAAGINQAFSDTLFEVAAFSLDHYEEYLKEDEVFAELKKIGQGYQIDMYTLPDSILEDTDTEALGQVLDQLFSEAKIEKAGASTRQMDQLGKSVQVQVMTSEEFQNPDTAGFETQFAVQYVYAILVMMICLISASFVVQSVAEEKTSKLVDLLMVSVRPLALLAGKVLAMMVYILIMIGVMLLGFGLSCFVSGRYLDLSVLGMGGGIFGSLFGSIHPGAAEILIIVVSLLLGYLTFSIIAGLAGCCCASMEDVQAANMTVVLIVMAGYLAACIVSAFETVPVYMASSLLPVISVFCAPVQYVLGNIGLGMLLISWLIQLMVIAFLALFSSRVYSSLIVYRGGRVKLRQLFSMAKVNGGRKA